ncbi:MAG: thioredoxin family protein [Thermodesulfovibrionales bacterium]
MKRIIILLAVIVSAFASIAYADNGITWVSLKDGMERSKTENKAMIIDFFFGPECPRCASLQKEVYDNPVIARKIMADFIPIRIDLTKKMTRDEEALGDKYEFKNDCLLLFMNYEGTLIKDQKGKKLCFIDKVDPEEFVSYLDHIKKTYEKASEKKAP